MYTGRIFDNHFHLNPDGDFRDGVRRFIKAGGNAINLTNLPDYSIGTYHYYERLYEKTIKTARIVKEEFQIEVFITIGPYPLDLIYFSKLSDKPEELIKLGMDTAAKIIEGEDANAMGEIGRPHFTVEPQVMEQSNTLLSYAFSLCSDIGCAAVLHTEDLDEPAMRGISKLAEQNGMRGDMVVKHHALPTNLDSQTQIVMSIPATRKFVRESLLRKRAFMLETDYINDRNDPNRFLPPDSVPLRAVMIREQYPDIYENVFENSFHSLPNHLYRR